MASPHDPTDPPRPALAALVVGMRRLREQAGLSQRALAEQMSYVRGYVTLAERGSRLPSREFLVRYAHALDATERLLPLWPWVYPFTNTRLASYRGGCATRLNLHALALPARQQALGGFGPTATRAKALTLTDLAASYLAAADVEQACAGAGEALEIGVEQRSQRIVGRVLAVRAQMASLHSAVAVQALDQRILATLLPSSGP